MKGKKWTVDEIEYLEKWWGTKSRIDISKHLNKSVGACKDKATRLGIGGCIDNINGFNVKHISEITGVDYQNIYKTWIKQNGLKVKKVGNITVIKEKDLYEFMKTNQHLWDARKCDYYYFYTYDWFLEKLETERNQGFPEMKKRKWTEYEERELIKLRKRGMSFEAIGKVLNRTKSSVWKKHSYLSGNEYSDLFKGA